MSGPSDKVNAIFFFFFILVQYVSYCMNLLWFFNYFNFELMDQKFCYDFLAF